jgi:hypothetical protein
MANGAAPGERRGGRTKGVPNKAKVAQIAALSGAAVPATTAIATAKTVDEAAAEPELGKRTLARYCAIYANLANVARAQMIRAEREGDEGRARFAAALREFEKWSKAAVWCADKLAPFQSPTYRAIAVIAPPPESPATPLERDGNVITLNDPVKAARVYANIMRASRQ